MEDSVVFRYTDGDALRDGVLVDISGLVPFPINRATRAVYDAFTRPLGELPAGYGGSPLIVSTQLGRLGDLVLSAIKKAQAVKKDEWLVTDIAFAGRRIWAAANGTKWGRGGPRYADTEGWTIMFPEDY